MIRIRYVFLLLLIAMLISALVMYCVIPTGEPQLIFVTQPPITQTIGSTIFSIVVQIQDSRGNIVTIDNGPVTLSLGNNPNGAVLTGTALTVNAINGIATFTGLSVDSAGIGYTLLATRTGLLVTGTSISFNVTGNPFISSWITTNAGISTNHQITLPLVSSGIYSFIVDWGDSTTSTITTWNQPEVKHTYISTGTYTVQFNGICTGWEFNNGGDKLKLLNITQWGTFKLGNTGSSFNGCANLTMMTPSDILNLSGTTNLSSTFRGCTNLISIANLNNWNVSLVTNMTNLFGNTSAFNQNITGWNTLNINNMSSMFNTATAFNQNIGGWNTFNVNNMSSMFAGATIFNQNIGGWNVSAVTNMSDIFAVATAFNQNITGWNVSSVTNMNQMFAFASAFNQNIGGWNVSEVTNMSGIFAGATIFNQNITGWNTSNVTNMSNVFQNATAFNQNIGIWNTGNVTNMSNMFFSATTFNQNISGWITLNVTNMSLMFDGATAFNQPLVAAGGGVWNVSKVTTMTSMFNGATAFNQDISTWNVIGLTGTTGADNMFTGATAWSAQTSPYTNYANLLIAWSGLAVKQTVTFDAGGAKYQSPSAAATARGVLTASLPSGDNWQITDGGIGA